MDWFRSWHGAPTDTKWLVIARKANVAPGLVSAVAWALLDYASQANPRGSVAGFDVETYATFTGWDETDIENVIAAMRAKGIIATDNRLASWDKRQPKREDDSTQRVRDWRAQRVTPPAQPAVTPCNAEERIVTQGNAPEENRGDTEENRTEGEEVAPDPTPNPDPIQRAIVNAYDACGLMTTRTHLEKHRETIARTGLPAWQLGFAEAHRVGKSNFPNYVARCAESAMLAEQQRANGAHGSNGSGPRLNPALEAARQIIEENNHAGR